MTSQPVSSIFLPSPLPSGTWRPVHSLMLPCHLFLCLPRLLPPFTVALAGPDKRETCYHFSSRFPLFHSGRVFHQLVCPLTFVLPQIFFKFTTLFSYPVFFIYFFLISAFFMHLLMLFISLYFSDPSGSISFFLSSLLLSQGSRISAVTQVFYFLLTMFA